MTDPRQLQAGHHNKRCDAAARGRADAHTAPHPAAALPAAPRGPLPWSGWSAGSGGRAWRSPGPLQRRGEANGERQGAGSGSWGPPGRRPRDIRAWLPPGIGWQGSAPRRSGFVTAREPALHGLASPGALAHCAVTLSMSAAAGLGWAGGELAGARGRQRAGAGRRREAGGSSSGLARAAGRGGRPLGCRRAACSHAAQHGQQGAAGLADAPR